MDNDTVLEYVVKNGIFTKAMPLLNIVREKMHEEGTGAALSHARSKRMFCDLPDETAIRIIKGELPVHPNRNGFTVYIGA